MWKSCATALKFKCSLILDSRRNVLHCCCWQILILWRATHAALPHQRSTTAFTLTLAGKFGTPTTLLYARIRGTHYGEGGVWMKALTWCIFDTDVYFTHSRCRTAGRGAWETMRRNANSVNHMFFIYEGDAPKIANRWVENRERDLLQFVRAFLL